MLLRSLLLGLLLTESVIAQAKVGTTGASFLEMSPSVRSNGMGELGVALADNESFFFNPASLGFVDDHRISLAGYPVSASFDVDELSFRSYSLMGHLLRGNYFDENPVALSFALQRISLTAEDLVEQTYQQGTFEGTGSMYSAKDRAYSVSVGASYLSFVQVGVGSTVRWVSEDFHDYDADGVAFDFGAMLRAPLSGTLNDVPNPEDFQAAVTAGAALSNVGPDLTLLDKKYPLPRTRRIGLAAEMSFYEFSVIASAEDQTETVVDDSRTMVGLELGYDSAVWGRIGHVGSSDYVGGYTTFGGTVSLRGLLNMLTENKSMEERRDLFDVLDLRASFATSSGEDHAALVGADFFLLELTF